MKRFFLLTPEEFQKAKEKSSVRVEQYLNRIKSLEEQIRHLLSDKLSHLTDREKLILTRPIFNTLFKLKQTEKEENKDKEEQENEPPSSSSSSDKETELDKNEVGAAMEMYRLFQEHVKQLQKEEEAREWEREVRNERMTPPSLTPPPFVKEEILSTPQTSSSTAAVAAIPFESAAKAVKKATESSQRKERVRNYTTKRKVEEEEDKEKTSKTRKVYVRTKKDVKLPAKKDEKNFYKEEDVTWVEL